MSSIWYQFCSPSQTSTIKSRSCDFCGLTLERLKRPPSSEQDRNEHAREFPKGAFIGWSSYSKVLRLDEHGNNVDLHLDFCAGCTSTMWDRMFFGVDETVLQRALTANKTIYLDARGREVNGPAVLEGRRVCIWRTEGKLGIRPCRRVHGHEGECSTEYEPGMVECPACVGDWDSEFVNLQPRLYTIQALENHAINEHLITYGDGVWRLSGRAFGPAAAGYEVDNVLQALLLVEDVRRNAALWRDP